MRSEKLRRAGSVLLGVLPLVSLLAGIARADGPRDGAIEAGMHDLDFFTNGNHAYFGIAVGLRHIVASDHGAAKFGVGYRRFVENSSNGLPGLNVIELKVAFDLWIPR